MVLYTTDNSKLTKLQLLKEIKAILTPTVYDIVTWSPSGATVGGLEMLKIPSM